MKESSWFFIWLERFKRDSNALSVFQLFFLNIVVIKIIVKKLKTRFYDIVYWKVRNIFFDLNDNSRIQSQEPYAFWNCIEIFLISIKKKFLLFFSSSVFCFFKTVTYLKEIYAELDTYCRKSFHAIYWFYRLFETQNWLRNKNREKNFKIENCQMIWRSRWVYRV